MKITYVKYVEPSTDISAFADLHGLEMVVQERDPSFPEFQKYYANFVEVEVIKDGMLESRFGNGSTPEYAIQEYCRQISGCKLSLPSGKRITTPKVLTYKEVK